MRTHSSSPPFHVRLLAAAALLLAASACEREILRDEARSGDTSPRLAVSTAPGEGQVRALNEHGDVVVTFNGRAYRWTRAGVVEPVASPRYVFVRDINNSGMMAGAAATGPELNARIRAAVWAPGGEPQMLPAQSEWILETAIAVNDAGVVAVWGTLEPYEGNRTYRWSAAQGTQLLPPAWSTQSPSQYNTNLEYVVDINAAGDILGTFDLFCEERYDVPPCNLSYFASGGVVWKALGPQVRLQWTGSRMRVRALDLNDAGQVVGSDNGRAALWAADGTLRVLADSGTARAINEAGVVVGEYVDAGQTHAFRWTEAGGLEDLGTLGGGGSAAMGVNAFGDATGWANTPDGVQHAFIATREGGMFALAAETGETSSTGLFINDAREVAGTSRVDGRNLAARWNDQSVARPPVAHAGGPYAGRISGRRYAYDASLSSDVDGPSLRYSWDMNADGTFDGVTNYPRLGYAYPAGGTYTILLEVRDGNGLRDTATTTVTIAQNVAPVISTLTGMPTSRGEGLPITLTPSVSDANQAVDSTELGLMRYRWDWGDGYTPAARISTHSYADQGTYTVRLIVTDAGGLADTVVRTAVIGNLPPTGRLVAPTSIGEGTVFTLSATALTDAPADLAAGFTVAFDCGGGFGAYGAATSIVCPARADQGSVTVRMRVKDKDGAASEATKTIPVGNVAPRVTATATSPTTFAAGGTFSVSATFTDVAGDAPWRYRIYWGDGASTPLTNVAGGATITGSHAYATPGTYTVQVAVADKDGGSGRSAPITVTVTP